MRIGANVGRTPRPEEPTIARVPPPTSVADLERYSEANPGWQIERDADGTILMSPSDSDGGRRNARLTYLLEAWNERVSRGSSTTRSCEIGARMNARRHFYGRGE